MIKEPLSQKEFTEIFHKVPRLTVEVIVLSPKGILLTKRQIEPCKGMWHIPGGTVRFGEHLTDAVHRKALDELSSDVIVDKFLGYIEYPSHYDEGLAAFNIALIPSVIGKQKPRLATSILTALFLLPELAVFGSLTYWYSFSMTLLNTLLWTTLAIQRIRQTLKK
jgi:ADP-ribose pyrophosphatase YjhB (NUDIX family)